jgi:hypothetical protein
LHGGDLADADNPHHKASGIEAAVHVAGAIEDQFFPDEQKDRLERSPREVIDILDGSQLEGWTYERSTAADV